ncbi:trk system potassium uptake protein TrkH [Tangfeifania diversioriginum]|uniref:Trk system potassium uptake protein TrkH n=1 Tax=Tangfeifania diversioriginum TaxID=1168035 RepID=A0A1M6A6E5_9BACT|nr:TrkH family potassium uptake protein [Tangfeifania diversioriginum]SHI31977.1 trk system potassium uptake protein TrkH [Tangfeifania diversioriginum]
MAQVLNIKLIAKVASRISFIVSGALLITVGIAFLFNENAGPFVITSLFSIAVGLIMYFLSRNLGKNEVITRKEAFLSVTVAWFYISLTGSLPFIISGAIPSFINAFFESASGFTTTGSSILTNIESLPKSILFWRSLTHWIGGIGIVVLFIVVMPSLQEGGYHLFTLESSFQDKIQPKIKSVGQRLLYIYVTLTAAETVFLLAGGMNLFESVCHAFGTVATGGFSPKNTSIGGYSPYIQYVVMLFMLLGGMNFVIHYYLVKREFKKIKANEEIRFFLLVVFGLGFIITLSLFFKAGKPIEESFRESFFQVISIVTCTGYATADYLLWPQFAWLIIFFAMFLGGSTGSTAGGIKMARHLLFFKNIRRFFRESAYPRAVIPLKLNGNVIKESTNQNIQSFLFTYLAVFAIGSAVLALTGLDGATAASSAATAMAGIGPGIGTVGPAANFAHLTGIAKLTMTFLMILGRLEIYTVLILFTPNFWKE